LLKNLDGVIDAALTVPYALDRSLRFAGAYFVFAGHSYIMPLT
jgi:hypothetical protein